MMNLIREPLVRFFLMGGAIFGLYALLDDTPPPMAAGALVVTDDDALRLVAEFEATWRRPPTVAELDFMIEDRVREEVYVREALALGFDRDDAVIRRRLQMKMEFLTESERRRSRQTTRRSKPISRRIPTGSPSRRLSRSNRCCSRTAWTRRRRRSSRRG